MIIKEKVVEAMNAQIQSEFTASAQYIAIAVYFDEESLPDLAAFFYRQSEEERMHAMKFVHFMLEAGAKPIIPSLPEMRNSFDSASDAVQFALDQEIKVTNQINNLVSIADAEKDYASSQFLQWFVTEQVEEVDSMTTLLDTIKHAGGTLLLVEDFVRRALAAGGAEAAPAE
ncbi:Ferritin-like protein 2 [hydrothermal vent metagenome]|uniref:Ferritin-like protein 2 n=1 Tax=hydrothermal vent metagenome TaxID=652676 RepID=A0A3B0VIB9_9ZZZZ